MNKNYNYQDIKFFNKKGYEIPLSIASNIVVKIYKKDNINDATIMNGVYMEEKSLDEKYYIIKDFKIIDCGKSFDDIEKIKEDINIDVYIDGKLIEDFIVNECEVISVKSFNIAYTSSNSLLEEYVRYGIENIKLNISIPNYYNLLFPSTVFVGNIEMETVSTELHSVETMYIGVVENNRLIKPYIENYDLMFLTDVKDDDIQFFVANKITDEIYKRHKIIIDLSDDNTFDDDYFDITSTDSKEEIYIDYIKTKIPQINICFSSKEEGVHEQKIYILLQNRNNTDDNIKIGEINVTVESIGEDERFRTLFSNFGIPDPILYPTLFKNADIKEENINWEIVNEKSKELFLSYDEIFPYVGTYKALINAIKFLGYDDVYFREWYKDLKNKITYSKRLNINENFNDYKDLYSDNILENRLSHKKLNKLTLVYKLNTETEEYDEYDNPIIKNVYNYSVDEVLLKIESLKKWLERNIIALNCRIIEITGEGVVYEKQAYKAYGSIMQNIEYEEILEFTPIIQNKIERLIDGSANIKVSILNESTTSEITFADFENNIGQYEKGNNGTILYPFNNNLYVKAFIECDVAKITGNIKNNNALFINNGEVLPIRDDSYSMKDVEFNKAPIIYLKNANIRVNPNKLVTYREWWDDILYQVRNDKNNNYSYSIENKKNNLKLTSNDYIILIPIDNNAKLKYSLKNKMSIPLFSFSGYQICLYNDNNQVINKNIFSDEEYLLEINEGKIINEESENKTSYIIFDYDNNNEQNIKVNYKYEGSQLLDYEVIIEDGIEKGKIYKPYFNINVNNIGNYRIMTYAINEYGNVFAKELLGGCSVIVDKPELGIYTKESFIENDKNFYYEDSLSNIDSNFILDSSIPIFKWRQHIFDLKFDKENNEISYPNISYAYDTPKREDYLQLMNIHDKIFINSFEKSEINVSHIIKNNNFYNVEDVVNIVFYNKLCLNGVYEIEGVIKSIKDNNYIIYIKDNNIQKYINDNNIEIYMFNITEYNIINTIIEGNQTKIFIDKEKVNAYKKGDKIKIKYDILDLNDYIYRKIEDGTFEQVFYVLDNDFIVVKYDDNIENLVSSFSGSSTYNINYVDKEKGMIIVDGKFYYKKYIDGIFYKKENDNTLYPLTIEDKGIIKTTKNNLDIKTTASISKNNQRYVNYIMKSSNDAIETENTKDIYVKTYKNRLYDFVDECYTLLPINFDKLNAFDYWYSNDNKEKYYLHKKPLTITKNNNIIISFNKDFFDVENVLWKIYRQNLLNKTRELLFEVENKNLTIKIKDEGIYDIELFLYDKYGNISKIDRQAFIKVK